MKARSRTLRGAAAAAVMFAVVSLAAAGASAAAGGLEAMKRLAGTWEGTNEKGQAVRLTYEVVATGSAVQETIEIQEKSRVDMVTLYHLDGDDLMLTHYCAAGNQPRMKAVSVKPGGIRFDFVDATGLVSSEAGHMRAAEFAFEGEDRLTSSWTWREKGADLFTVVVKARRVDGVPSGGN